jgi:hypothetical protein
MIPTDEIVRAEEFKIERFGALGLGRYDAIRAIEAGVDWQAVEWLVKAKDYPLAVALDSAQSYLHGKDESLGKDATNVGRWP